MKTIPFPRSWFSFGERARARCVLSAHQWELSHSLNAGFYHHGALRRTGHICKNCAEVRFPETNQEYYAALPTCMKNDPALHIPSDVNPTA